MPECGISNIVFNIIDIICGIFLVIEGFLSFNSSFQGVFLPVYRIIFGIVVIIFAIYMLPILQTMMPFYLTFIGRGLTFLFLGCLCLGGGNNPGKISYIIYYYTI